MPHRHGHDDVHQESSMSHDDMQVSQRNSGSDSVNANNCPCAPTPQQREISQALFKVPEGFQALLKHITRELLNAKPKDPYVYIADYLKTKLNDKRRGKTDEILF
ncbi:hypothetical protein BV898_01692 [Hypsibius exemplaris]|uniref:RIIa domain-containing protein n=1 Tax=Hypsibius exemplaris TaxID=2072580 RepID=A0A1W0XAV2_HYPEX|nr:hypothetical protein BV898_01692 [Hypsibius exemplaris]